MTPFLHDTGQYDNQSILDHSMDVVSVIFESFPIDNDHVRFFCVVVEWQSEWLVEPRLLPVPVPHHQEYPAHLASPHQPSYPQRLYCPLFIKNSQPLLKSMNQNCPFPPETLSIKMQNCSIFFIRNINTACVSQIGPSSTSCVNNCGD